MKRHEAVLREPPPDSDSVVGEVFATHRLALLRLAVLLVGDEATAEDVVQDAFVGLHRRLSTLESSTKALAYVRASVVNGCRSAMRRRSVARRFGGMYEPPIWSAESSVLLDHDRRRVMAALQRLPRRRREVLVLRYYLDLDYAEIADAMGITQVTVRTTLARAVAALAQLLGNEE